MERITQYLAIKAGARIIKDSYGRATFAVVAPANSFIYREVYRESPDILFTKLSDALLAMPDGSLTDQIPSTIYIAPGVYTETAKTVVGKEQSGLRIYFDRGAELTTSTALTAGDGLLEIEGDSVQIAGFPLLTNSAASQTGSALIVGGSETIEGNGDRVYIENLRIEGDATSIDWAKTVRVRGSKNGYMKDCYLYGSAGTTQIIGLETVDSRTVTSWTLDNVNANAIGDTGNSCVPLESDVSSNYCVIKGGSYITDGAGKAMIIKGNHWLLSEGGIAGSTASIAAGSHIDLQTATTIRVGQFYVKDINANAAAALFDQTNV